MTVPPDRSHNVEQWETDKLILILLRQFKRLLADHGITLTDRAMQQIAEAAAVQTPPATTYEDICKTLADLIDESLQLLAGYGLASYATALNTEMTDLEWETTADFLDLANEKVNAEMRINTGAALMVLLGDFRHANMLVDTIEYDLATNGVLDVDATIARRALLHGAGLPQTEENWLQYAKAWVDQKTSPTK